MSARIGTATTREHHVAEATVPEPRKTLAEQKLLLNRCFCAETRVTKGLSDWPLPDRILPSDVGGLDMDWDHYIPLAVVGRQFDTQSTRLGPTIWDFAGTTPRQMSSELDAIVQDCVGRGGRHLLVNIDGTCLMNLMESYQNMTPASFGGAVPLRLDTGTQAPMPDSISLIIEAGDCVVVDTSTDQQKFAIIWEGSSLTR